MSEQTPNSPENLQETSVSGGEPSMEDILASIRKIISEDEPVAMESPEDIVSELHSDAVTRNDSQIETSAAPRLDVVDLDVDAVLAQIDADEALSKSDASIADAPIADSSQQDVDILELLDMDIPMEDDFDNAPSLSGSAAALATESQPEVLIESQIEPTPIAIDEMDMLLDKILSSSDEDQDEDGTTVETDAAASVDDDPDLALVKSLMADLSDNTEDEAQLETLLAIPESEPETGEPSDDIIDETASEILAPAEAVEPDVDILGDILNMTLDDEIRTHPEDPDLPSSGTIAADETANIQANHVSEQIATAQSADDLPSLAEIAAAAEADADAVEAPLTTSVTAPNPVAATIGLTAAGAGLASLGAMTLGQDATPSDQTDLDEIPEHTEQEIASQEPSMPVQAVNTDTILDDVTESAAAGAFAQLTNVVEEKAVFNERGPRIGDLVQEALRPMLKEWLDANLKGIVERAVAKEVKRISTGK